MQNRVKIIIFKDLGYLVSAAKFLLAFDIFCIFSKVLYGSLLTLSGIYYFPIYCYSVEYFCLAF